MLAGNNSTAAIPFGSLRRDISEMVETAFEIEPPEHEAQEETHEVVR